MFPTGQFTVSCCAPTEREPNNVTTGYKHLAPAGAKSDIINSLRFKLEFVNDKWKIICLSPHLKENNLNDVNNHQRQHYRRRNHMWRDPDLQQAMEID